MEEQTDGLHEAPPRSLADPRNGMSDKPDAYRSNGLSIKIPRPEDDETQSSHLISPLPTPSTLQGASAATSSTNGDSLPTIHSDEDYISSDASSARTRHEQNETSESSFLSDSNPSQATTLEHKKESSGGSDDAQTQSSREGNQEGVRRLSAAEMKHLTGSRQSLPFAVLPDNIKGVTQGRSRRLSASQLQAIRQSILASSAIEDDAVDDGGSRGTSPPRRAKGSRTLSTPPTTRNGRSQQTSPRRNSSNPIGVFNLRSLPNTPIVNLKPFPHLTSQKRDTPLPTPAATAAVPLIPVPPISLPTHLQLELAAHAPSPLYIQRPEGVDAPYESSAVKLERLKNVILLPPFLERTLTFGALACLDSWLYTFTILPLRFLIALGVLVQWWGHVVAKEIRWITGFVWYGLGRLWTRGRGGGGGDGRRASESSQCTPVEERAGGATGRNCLGGQYDGAVSLRRPQAGQVGLESLRSNPPHTKRQGSTTFRHRRTKSRPSNLSAYNKADLLQGLIIIFSSMALMKLDGSRMYHFIRAQSDIKLYVIFNVLEVGDRLLGAIGQDILECLFSAETLSRTSSGRSRVAHPLGMFLLALLYNVAHAVALYFQCITLNVAVNSYSNALLTLLMSNQFVEVKSTVFKRFERDNLFQLTCADIVERFQLWIMLLVIGMRNVVEVGGLSVPGAWSGGGGNGGMGGGGGGGGGGAMPSSTQPLHSPTILPHSFTVLPSWLWSGEVLSPFLIVLGSEMFVDTIKHAYVTKFNNIKPAFYSRIEDILCKDYYTNAFTTPSLTRRLGLPVLPLSSLFIRASFQTYHTLLSTRLSPPLPPSPHTSLAEQHPASPTSPAVTAALERFDALIRDALGRSVYGDPFSTTSTGRLRHAQRRWYDWTRDDLIALVTMLVFFFLVFLVLLMVKLVLGMALLHYSRRRYARMKKREAAVARGEEEEESWRAEGKRSGGYGAVEVGEGRSRWLNVDKGEGLRKIPKGGGKEGDLERVERYEMVAKRIW